ncbi:MAG: ABC transporter substrate-binding protein [bacterium]
MAEEFWPVDDAGNKSGFSLDWRFKLRKRVMWKKPDGMKSLFTAEDVKYTMDIIRNPRTSPKDELLCAYLNDRPAEGSHPKVPAIKVINPFLVQIGLNHPAFNPRRFFGFKLVKFNPDSRYWKREGPGGSPYRFNPVGTGPYVLKKRKSRTILFRKNNDYWGWKENPGQNIQEVAFNRYDDRKGMIQACFFNYGRKDALDIIPDLLPDEIAAFEEDPRHYTSDLNLYNFYFIGFNFGPNGELGRLIKRLQSLKSKKEAALTALGIREAMLTGFNRENALSIYGDAPGELLEGPYRSGSWAYTGDGKPKRRYSPAEARATLAAIDLPGGTGSFRLCYRQGDSYDERVASKFTDDMENIGIKIIPVGISRPMWQKKIYQQRDFDLVLDRYLYREDMDISPFFSRGSGLLGYQNELLGEYLAKIRNSRLRRDEIQGLYQAMDRFLWKKLPVLFLWSLNQCVGVRSNLVEVTGSITEPLRAFDGYDFYGNIPRWRVRK